MYTNPVLQIHVEPSFYQDVQISELFSHVWIHMKEMVYDWPWDELLLTSSSYNVYVTQQFKDL